MVITNYLITPFTLQIRLYGLKMNDSKEQLEKSIQFAKYRLKQFTKEKLTTESANVAYNKLLIEKAVMVKELQDLDENKFKKFWQKCFRKVTRKKLICDSF